MRKADNLPPSCAVVTKSRNLNFLEPSEPVQACNETALPFYYIPVHVSSTNVLIYRRTIVLTQHLVTGGLNGHLKRVTIPDIILI